METQVLTFADQVRPKREAVTIVGSGITALMSAWEAQKAGYQVHVVSQSPDPRMKAANEQPQYSSTFDGQDQRYITLFEGHPYLDLVDYVQKVYPKIGDDFMKPVVEGGVLAVRFGQFSERSQNWLLKRKKINDDLKGGDVRLKAKIKTLFDAYAKENRAAMEKWYGFIGELLDADPSLAKKISLSHNGIMRLYDNKDVLDTSAVSHKVGGVFKKQYAPGELKKDFPAYAAGVENGFIQGGSVEMHGLTLGVKTIAEAMINILEARGVTFAFNKRVEKPVLNAYGKVEGLRLAGGDIVTSKHYLLHPGAMGLQELYKEAAPDIQNAIATIEGYWITVKGAEEIVRRMGGKPNKVHGKQSLEVLLEKVDATSKATFTELFHGLGVADFKHIAPIVDFNIMPIYSEDGKATLGVGSGYVFKGLSEPDERNFPAFRDNERSEQFVLALMKLWLAALYGEKLIPLENMQAADKGCKRSWTIDDKEVDRNMLTADGGVLAIRGGGNTGDTTKSTFVAGYNVDLLKAVDGGKAVTQDAMRRMARSIRKSLRKNPEEVDFARLTAELEAKVVAAEKRATIAARSSHPEAPDVGASVGRAP